MALATVALRKRVRERKTIGGDRLQERGWRMMEASGFAVVEAISTRMPNPFLLERVAWRTTSSGGPKGP